MECTELPPIEADAAPAPASAPKLPRPKHPPPPPKHPPPLPKHPPPLPKYPPRRPPPRPRPPGARDRDAHGRARPCTGSHARPADHTRAPPTPAPAPARAATPSRASTTRTVRVDAERLDALMDLMGELVIHRTAVEALTQKLEIPGMYRGRAAFHPKLPRPAGDGHEGADDPRRRRAPPFPRLVRDLPPGSPRRSSSTSSASDTDSTAPSSMRSATRSSTWSATRSITGSNRPRIARARASRASASSCVSAPQRRQRRHRGGGRRPWPRPKLIGRKAPREGPIDEPRASVLVTAARSISCSRPASPPPTRHDVSGRGVGMDAVREQIRGLGGEVVIDSTFGRGHTAQIRLPLDTRDRVRPSGRHRGCAVCDSDRSGSSAP